MGIMLKILSLLQKPAFPIKFSTLLPKADFSELRKIFLGIELMILAILSYKQGDFKSPLLKSPLLILVFYLVLPSIPLWGQIQGTLNAPQLGPGSAGLEQIVQRQAEGFIQNIITLAEDSLNKPLFLQAFNGASATQSILWVSPLDEEQISIFLGSQGSLWTASLDQDYFNQVTSLSSNGDLELGLVVQPLQVQGFLPLTILIPGLSFQGKLGYLQTKASSLQVETFSLGLGLGYLLIPEQVELEGRGKPIKHNGVKVFGNLGWTLSTLGTTLQPGPIYQTIPLDPDSSGPLLPFYATIQIDPSIDAAIISNAFSINLGFSSALEFLHAIRLRGSIGFTTSWTESKIEIEMEEPISVSGYLANLIEEPGQVRLWGKTEGETNLYFLPNVGLEMSFLVGSFMVSIPFTWAIPKGLGIAVTVGLAL